MGTPGPRLRGLPTPPEPAWPYSAWRDRRPRLRRFEPSAVVVWLVVIPAFWAAVVVIVLWLAGEL